MGTFLSLVGFELRFYARRISTWIYFGLFFALSFLISAVACGAFKSLPVAVGGAGGIVNANSPYLAAGLVLSMIPFGILVVTALMGNAVYRDFETGIHPLFFTSPVKKWQFLTGRFVGAFLINVLVLASVPLGLFLATVMPFVDQEKLGPRDAWAYLHPYLTGALPSILFAGAIFFALASFTRKMLPNYLGGVALLVGYLLASNLLADLDNKTIASLLDPFGLSAFTVVTEYWTPAEKNARLVPLFSLVGVNRLLWLGVGMAVFAACYARFRFAHVASEKLGRRKAGEPEGAGLRPGMALTLPAVTRDFSWRAQAMQAWSVLKASFSGIVLNVYFPAIVGAGLLFLIFSAGQVGKLYGTPTWPVTYQVLEILGGTFGLFVIIIVTFYAGELIWQERDLKIHQVTDSLPSPSWASLAGKAGALALVVVVLQLVVIVAGILTQASKGYFNFELGLYAKVLLGLSLASYLLYVVFTLLVHVLVNNKYLAHVVVILTYFGMGFLPGLGFEHVLYRYGRDTGWTYSDMNGFGTFLAGVTVTKLYWGALAVLLALAANLLWVRGQETGLRTRLALARQRLGGASLAVAVGALAAAVALGAFVFYNTNVLNEYTTSYEREKEQARYERAYKVREKLPQPRITGVKIDVDLQPETSGVDFRGTYALANETGQPISEVDVLLPTEAEVRTLELGVPATLSPEDHDEKLGYRIYRLKEPLAPGATTELRFDLGYHPKGFGVSGPDTTVVGNGAFVNSGLLPSFGYSPDGELFDDDTRRKHDFEPKERMAKVDDAEARKNTYVSRDGDWISFEAIVSTAPDQIALAPGYLQREWMEDGRRHFEYRMDAPILNFYSFVSARWEVKRDAWNDVALEVYYHPGHEYNVDRMIDAMKKSLDYYTREFGPYQHRQARILEFPRIYGTFAQSFPNTIPYSEAIGFITRLDRSEDIDYTYYVTAHEIAHQWWAHQVIGGDVQGSTLLSESLSQYSALMVMERQYGAAKMRKFLKHELDSYLTGRAFERKKELPIALNENQQYIHYNKGSLVFYALKEYLGEAELNRVIREYTARVRFQEPPFTNSLELVDAIRAAAPEHLRGFVDDLFLKITLYELRTKEARRRKLDDGRWEVTLEYEAKKLEADEKGDEIERPLDLEIEVGVLAAGLTPSEDDDEPLVLERRRITSGTGTLTFVVTGEPVRAGLDPRHVLVDRRPDDNVARVKDGAAASS